MDKGAKALKELKDAGVPVIWRPFHEFDGKWFWWGKGGADNFKKLWKIMYERYTNYWGLDNLIWNLGYCGDVNGGWYPGDQYVDIIGADTYVDHSNSLVNLYSKTAQVAKKPVCLHENGPIPDPEKMKSDGAKWLFFMTWHTSFIDSNPINTSDYIKRVYNSNYMLTLDELLEFLKPMKGLYVEFELKTTPVDLYPEPRLREYCEKLYSAVMAAKPADAEFVFTSADYRGLRYLQQMHPGVDLLLITGKPLNDETIALCKAMGISRIGAVMEGSSRASVTKAHKEGLTVSLWPGQSVNDFVLGAYLGADFMCTDIPVEVKKFAAKKTPWLNVIY